jgi:hypothetical protein
MTQFSIQWILSLNWLCQKWGQVQSGELTIEKKDGTKQHFVAGQAVTETVNSVHRGITGAEPTVLIVFYPGTPGLPLSR